MTAPLWTLGPSSPFLHIFSVYSCHLFLISSASVRSYHFCPFWCPSFVLFFYKDLIHICWIYTCFSFLVDTVNGIVFFKFQILLVYCWFVGKWLIFAYWACILWLCYSHLLVQEFFCQFFSIFYLDNHVICEQKQFYVFLPNMYTF